MTTKHKASKHPGQSGFERALENAARNVTAWTGSTSAFAIPPSETDSAGLELNAAEHEALVSPLIEHVEVAHAASYVDKLSLVSFMAHML